MDAGRLRHRVLIQSPTNTQDPVTGEQVLTWTDVATVWAAIEPLSAKEFIAASATQSEVSARIVIRYRSGLNATMRLVHMVNGAASAYYNPAGFLADKDSGIEYLTIPVSAGVSDGQ